VLKCGVAHRALYDLRYAVRTINRQYVASVSVRVLTPDHLNLKQVI
jgi:hypothetical protein